VIEVSGCGYRFVYAGASSFSVFRQADADVPYDVVTLPEWVVAKRVTTEALAMLAGAWIRDHASPAERLCTLETAAEQDRRARPWRWQYVCRACGMGVVNGPHNIGPWLHLNGDTTHAVEPIDRPDAPRRSERAETLYPFWTT
jgi:hypothetical protein